MERSERKFSASAKCREHPSFLGTLSVYMNGYLLCASISLAHLLNAPCRVLEARLSTTLTTFSTVCQVIQVYCIAISAKSRLPFRFHALQDDDGGSRLVVVSVPIFSSYFEEWQSLGSKYAVLHGIMHFLRATLKQISEAWEGERLDTEEIVADFCKGIFLTGITTEMDAKLESYAKKVLPGCVSADFLELLLFGKPSEELKDFLQRDLTEKGLKKLIVSMDATYLNINRLLVQYLHSVSQERRPLDFHEGEGIRNFI